jgi:hypothetical protein
MCNCRDSAVPRASHHRKETSFNFRIDPALKAAFAAATEAEDKPAAQVVRDLMRSYVKVRQRLIFEAEARRQSLAAAQAALDPDSDEFAVMREIEVELADPSFWEDQQA